MASFKDPNLNAQEEPKKSRNPADVLKDPTITDEEKLKKLKVLEDDQKALLRADDESMVREIEPEKSPAELLANVKKAEQKLKEQNPDLG